MSKSGLKQGLAKVQSLRLDGRDDLALAEVDRLSRAHPENPQLLVLRAELIQLQADEDGKPTLEDAKQDLIRAASLDEDSPGALIELGHFLHAVEDDLEGARKQFGRAITLSRRLLAEALLGQAEVLLESGRAAEAFDCLSDARRLRQHLGKAFDNITFDERLRLLLQTG